jgi:hypothetical protein
LPPSQLASAWSLFRAKTHNNGFQLLEAILRSSQMMRLLAAIEDTYNRRILAQINEECAKRGVLNCE